MTSIGTTLVEARRERQASLGDAAAATRIREVYLVALEAEDWGKIGSRAWCRSFIQSYAQFLAIDPDPLVAIFDSQVSYDFEGAALPGINPETIGRVRRQMVVRRVAVALLAIAGLGVVLGLFANRAKVPQVTDASLAPAPVNATPHATQAPVADWSHLPQHERQRQELLHTITSQVKPQQSTGSPMGPLTLTLEATAKVAVHVVFPIGQPAHNLEPGQVLALTDDDALQVVISPAHGVVASVNGNMLPPLGEGPTVQLTCLAQQVACEALDR